MSVEKMVVVFGIGVVVCGIAFIVIIVTERRSDKAMPVVTSEREVPMDRQIIMLRRFGIML